MRFRSAVSFACVSWYFCIIGARRSIRSRSMLRVRGSTSTNTGRAPTSRMTLLVATQVSGVVMTSCSGPTPAMRTIDAVRSIMMAGKSTVLPWAITPGQRTMHGTRIPPSRRPPDK